MLKRPLHILSGKLRRKRKPVDWMKEKWIADFSKAEKSCFDIKPEIAFSANLAKGPFSPSSRASKTDALFLGLKKNNDVAWVETAQRVYVDQVIEARFHLDSRGGNCAAGLMFRVMEQGGYYRALVSGKGAFRLDHVGEMSSRPLIGWIDVPEYHDGGLGLNIIARENHLIFILNGKWIAEVYDAANPGGHLGFVLVAYDQEQHSGDDYSCKAWLDRLSVDSRPAAVEAAYHQWRDSVEISAESRMRLAESFAALAFFEPAYQQITRAWKQREEAARSVMATYTETRTRKELLFAAQMAARLEQYAAAEEYIDVCLAANNTENGEDWLELVSEKAIILSNWGKYHEQEAFLSSAIKRIAHDSPGKSLPSLYALLGHAFWNLQNYRAAANTWDKAFSLNANNGLYATSAADAWEILGKKTEALKRLLAGGNCFLAQGQYQELGEIVPKLLELGKKNGEAHALAAQWALAIGDKDRAQAELALSHSLQGGAQAVKKTTAAKPAAQTKAGGKKAVKAPQTKPGGERVVEKKSARTAHKARGKPGAQK